MGTHLHVHARWSVSAALLLLVASLAPGLALGVSSRTSPLASPMASPAPVIRTLDLAAMALTPIDLDDVGLTGFGQQTSEFLTLEEQVEQLAAAPEPRQGRGSDPRWSVRGGVPTPLSAPAWLPLAAGSASLPAPNVRRSLRDRIRLC